MPEALVDEHRKLAVARQLLQRLELEEDLRVGTKIVEDPAETTPSATVGFSVNSTTLPPSTFISP